METEKTKRTLRATHLTIRDSLSREEQLTKSHEIMESVVASYDFMRARHILVYASYGSEVVTRGIMEYGILLGKQVYCPKVMADGEMEFYRIASYEDLKPGYRGIPEPAEDASEKFITDVIHKTGNEESEAVLVLMPGVCFDGNGHRIGYGKGFYDRYLTKIPHAVKMALAYDNQLEDSIPAAEHDVLYDLLVTELQTICLME